MPDLTASILQFFLMLLFAYAIVAFPLGFLFSRLGESKTAAWIPVYNLWLFYRLGGITPILSLSFFAPVWAGIIGMYARGIGLDQSAGAIVTIIILACILTFIVSSSFAAYNISNEVAQSGLWVILWVVNSTIWLYIMAFVKFAPQNPVMLQNQGYSSPQPYPANPGPYSSQPYPPTSSAPSGYTPQAQPNYTPPPTLGGNDNGGWGLVNGGNNDDNPYIK